MKSKNAICHVIVCFCFAISSCEKSKSLPSSNELIAENSLVAGVVIESVGGEPITNAEIIVEGTQFKSLTNNRGEYNIRYLPGKFVLLASAPGYLFNKLELNVSMATTIPAAPIKLVSYPDTGVWEKFFLENLPKYEARPGLSFGNFVGIENLKVDGYDQLSDHEVAARITASFRAIYQINAGTTLSSSFQDITDLRAGRQQGEEWNVTFKVKLQNATGSNLWTWIQGAEL